MLRLLFLLLSTTLIAPTANAQSVTFYLCNDCTYASARDGETITFMTNGKVKINGKPATNFSCRNNDGVVELRYKGKLVNNLNWYRAQEKGYDLMDDRDIGYKLVKCTGNMPSVPELMQGGGRKRR